MKLTVRFLLPAFIIGLSACGRQQLAYLPSAPQLPFLTRAGELRLAGSINMSGVGDIVTPYFALQGAYALKDSMGLVGSLAYAPDSPDSDLRSITSMKFAEFGAGLFRYDGIYRFEGYGGLGYGSVNSRYSDDIYKPDATNKKEHLVQHALVQKQLNFIRPFLQGAVGIEGQVGAMALGVRLSLLVSTHAATDSISWSLADSLARPPVQANTVTSASTFHHAGLYFEPTAMYRVGYKAVKYQFQVWWSTPLTGDPPFVWGVVNYSVGVSVDLDP